MSKSKLELVLEYLMNDQEDKAKALIHDIFIEKARAIHETMIEDEGEDLENEVKHGSKNLEAASDEIDAEEEDMPIRSEGHEDDDDSDFSMDDEDESEIDLDDGAEEDDEDKFAGMGDTLEDLEDALEELKAAFAKVSGSEEDEDMDDEEETEGSEEPDEEEHDEDEEFDEMMESLDLDVLRDVYTKGGTEERESGDGPKFAKPGVVKTSPVPKSQTTGLTGSKPVRFDQGKTAKGFDYPDAAVGYDHKVPGELKHGGDNRRKRAESGTEKEAEGYGKVRSRDSKLQATAKDFKVGNTPSPFTKIKR
jgi:hypothetical protein